MEDTKYGAKEIVWKAVGIAMEHPEDRAAMFDLITELYGTQIWSDLCEVNTPDNTQTEIDKKQLEDTVAAQENEIRRLRSILDAAVRSHQICKLCALDGDEHSKSCLIHDGICGGFFDSRLGKFGAENQ